MSHLSEIPQAFSEPSLLKDMFSGFRSLLSTFGLVDHDAEIIKALDCASHGICVFDADEKLVFVNDSFCQLYRQPKETLPRGTSFEDMLTASIALGNYKGLTIERILADRQEFIACGVPGTFLQSLGDGRLISISHQPMETGGWIAVYDDVTARREIEKNLKFQSHHDALTMLPNRLFVAERLREAVALDGGCSLIHLDLDGFKHVNERFGHIAGDELLAQAAARLTKEIRGDQLAGRLGGAAFAVVLPGAGLEAASQLASRLERSLGLPFWVGATSSVRVDISVGLATAPDHGRTPELLIKHADRTLSQQKRSHRVSRAASPTLSAAPATAA